MEELKFKIDILPNQFLKKDGTFDKKEALKLSGKIAGVCYDKEGFNHLQNEAEEKTMRRINLTLENGHHSVYDHITINFNMQNIPKILAMVLNNEKQYTTSEKSARYTPVIREEGTIISEREEKLYNKWLNIFVLKIKSQYGNVFNDIKIKKLAQENARYLVTVFMPTQMIYSTSLRQINYIASWMEDYIVKADWQDSFQDNLAHAMERCIGELLDKNVLVEELMKNEKNRKLSLFGKDLDKRREYFGDIYLTLYKGSLAQLAQSQRSRPNDHQMEFLKQKEYFIPPIIEDDEILKAEWLSDMISLKDIMPQGEIVKICERGIYEKFIEKCKDRLCSAAQLEIMNQTKETLLKYKRELELSNHPLVADIQKYSHGARCTFPDFNCPADCHFKEGKTLVRRI